MRRFAALLVALATVLAGAACSSTPAKRGGSGSPGSPTSPADAALLAGVAAGSAWRAVLHEIRPDGTVTPATALAAFATAIGPVGGASAPPGTRAPIPSGDLALDWVFANWPELTAAEQQAIAADLDGAHTSAESDATAAYLVAARPSPDPSDIDCPGGNSAASAQYVAQVSGIKSAIGAHTGVPFTLPVTITVNTHQVSIPEGDAEAYSTGCESPGSSAIQSCSVHLQPSLLGQHGGLLEADVHATLIHELMHCYLYQVLGWDYDWTPAWYLEGVPTWVETSLTGGGDTIDDYWWEEYLLNPDEPLSARTYDGMGFFAHLQETGTDVWRSLIRIGRGAEHGTSGGWQAAQPTSAFLSTWGSGYAQGRYPGRSWETIFPGLAPYRPDLVAQPVTDGATDVGSTAALTSYPFGPAIGAFDVSAQVVHVSTKGAAQGLLAVGNGAQTALAATEGVNYCTDTEGCKCPPGSLYADAHFTPMSAGIRYLGLTGGTGSALVTMSGESLASFCGKPCVQGTWSLAGQSGNGTATPYPAGLRFEVSASGADGSFPFELDADASRPIQESAGGLTVTGQAQGTSSGHLTITPTLLTVSFSSQGITISLKFDGQAVSSPTSLDTGIGSGTDQFTCDASTLVVTHDGFQDSYDRLSS